MDVLADFVLTSVSGRIKRPPSSDAAPAVTAVPNPLAALPGKWKGRGFNQIWRPFHGSQDRFLELNETIETLQFEAIPGKGVRGLVDGDRFASTAIYYLLQEGKVSAWHRVVDADEVWHFYAGAPLELTVADGPKRSTTLREASISFWSCGAAGPSGHTAA